MLRTNFKETASFSPALPQSEFEVLGLLVARCEAAGGKDGVEKRQLLHVKKTGHCKLWRRVYTNAQNPVMIQFS